MILVVDAGLSTEGGHHLALLRSAVEELRPRGRPMALITNQAARGVDVAGLPVLPALSGSGYEGLPPEGASEEEAAEATGRLRRQALELLAAEGRLPAVEEVHVLNAGPEMLATLALWLQARPGGFAGRLVVYVLYDLGLQVAEHGGRRFVRLLDAVRARASRDAARLIAARCRDVTYAAASRARSREVQLVTGRAPRPTGLRLSAQRGTALRRLLDRRFVCLYLGDAKPEKGFLVLPALAARLRARRRDLGILVQAVGAWDVSVQVAEGLRALAAGDPEVVFHEGFLDDLAYRLVLERAEAVVLPYRRGDYVSKSSGILEEALWLGTPVVVPQGTELEGRLAALGVRQPTFRRHRAEDVLEAVLDGLDRQAEFRSQARLAAARLAALAPVVVAGADASGARPG